MKIDLIKLEKLLEALPDNAEYIVTIENGDGVNLRLNLVKVDYDEDDLP